MKRTKQWNWLWFGLFMAMTLVLTGCSGGKDSPAAPAPILTVVQTPLVFTATAEGGANPADQTFSIANTGSDATTLDWRATSDKTWLTLTPANGAIVEGDPAQTVTASVNIAGLIAGTRTATITVEATGLASKTITVTLTIGNALTSSASAGIAINGTAGSNPANQTVTLANAGSAALNWSAASSVNWLTITPFSGTLAGSGAAANISLKLESQGLAAGTYTGNVTITAPGVANLVIPVTLTLTAPVPTTAKSGNIFVGGTAGVTQLSSLLARALHKSATPGAEVLADARVTVTLIKPDGAQSTATTVTDSRGAYTLQLEGVAGDIVTVVIEKEGYTSINKTFTLSDADFAVEGVTRQVTVSGQASQAFTAVVKADASGGPFKASGEATPGFSFGLMRLPDGTHKAYASRSALRKAADSSGGIPELEISIPQSWAPNATALTTRLAAFNPADPEERAMFPGEFKGEGGAVPGVAAKAAAQPTYQLESVSFFSAEVTPNDGQPLTASRATGASKAAAAPTIITKYIPNSGCEAIKKYSDRDTVAAGVQVPLYTYNPNSGKWGYLGEGTLQTWDGGNYTNVDTAGVTGLDGTLSGLSCGSTTSYYFQIVATDWYTWWNLDYPLVFAQPELVTVKGKVVDGSGAGIPGAYVTADGYAKGGNSYHYGYAQNDGSFAFDVLTDSANGKTLANFDFTARNYSDWTTQAVPFVPPSPSLIADKLVSDAGEVTIADRLSCRINGKMNQKVGTTLTPFANVWIWAQNNDYSFYNWAETDTNGGFSMKTVCNEPINLWVWGSAYVVTVDGTAVGIESSDSGGVVVMADIDKVNQPPEVWTWYSPYNAKAGKPVELSASAWDIEGDYPLTYQWTITDAAGKVVPNTTTDYYTFTWTPSSAGTYTASVTVRDSKNNPTVKSEVISVTEVINTPPVAWVWSDTTACNIAPNLYAYAYDPDGDVLTYSWEEKQTNGSWSPLTGNWYAALYGSYPPAPTQSSVSYTGGANGYSDDFYFTPTSSPTGEVRLAVNDGKTIVYQNVTITPAGGLTVYYAEAWPTQPLLDGTVELYASAADSSGVVAYTWGVTAPDNTTTALSGGYVQFIADQHGTYNITLTAEGGCGSEIRNLQVTVPTPPPTTITEGISFIQYRTFETGTNSYAGFIEYKDNGVPVAQTDLATASIRDPLNNPLPAAPVFIQANYLVATWDAGTSTFGPATPSGYAGYFFDLGTADLAPGTYTFRTTLAEGQLLQTTRNVASRVEAPVVPFSSMLTTKNSTNNSLTLSWTAPATGTFSTYRVVVRKVLATSSPEIFYAIVPVGTTSITLSQTLLAQIALNAGVSQTSPLSWEVQTRVYDANSIEIARGYSDRRSTTATTGNVEIN